MENSKTHIQCTVHQRKLCQKLLDISVRDDCTHSWIKPLSRCVLKTMRTSSAPNLKLDCSQLFSSWNDDSKCFCKPAKTNFSKTTSVSSVKFKDSTATNIRNLTKDYSSQQYKEKLKKYNYMFTHYSDVSNHIKHYRKYHTSAGLRRCQSDANLNINNVKTSVLSPLYKLDPLLHSNDNTFLNVTKEITNLDTSPTVKAQKVSDIDTSTLYKYRLNSTSDSVLKHDNVKAPNPLNFEFLAFTKPSVYSKTMYRKPTLTLTKRDPESLIIPGYNKLSEIVKTNTLVNTNTHEDDHNMQLLVNGVNPELRITPSLRPKRTKPQKPILPQTELKILPVVRPTQDKLYMSLTNQFQPVPK